MAVRPQQLENYVRWCLAQYCSSQQEVYLVALMNCIIFSGKLLLSNLAGNEYAGLRAVFSRQQASDTECDKRESYTLSLHRQMQKLQRTRLDLDKHKHDLDQYKNELWDYGQGLEIQNHELQMHIKRIQGQMHNLDHLDNVLEHSNCDVEHSYKELELCSQHLESSIKTLSSHMEHIDAGSNLNRGNECQESSGQHAEICSHRPYHSNVENEGDVPAEPDTDSGESKMDFIISQTSANQMSRLPCMLQRKFKSSNSNQRCTVSRGGDFHAVCSLLI